VLSFEGVVRGGTLCNDTNILEMFNFICLSFDHNGVDQISKLRLDHLQINICFTS